MTDQHQLSRTDPGGYAGDFACTCGLTWPEADGDAARAHVAPAPAVDDGQAFFDARFARAQRMERWDPR